MITIFEGFLSDMPLGVLEPLFISAFFCANLRHNLEGTPEVMQAQISFEEKEKE